MLQIIITTIKALLNRILGNPVASAIVMALVDDLKEEGTKMLGVVVANVKAVAAKEGMTNQQKFEEVFNATKQQFPEAASSLISTTIEAAYRAYSQGKI